MTSPAATASMPQPKPIKAYRRSTLSEKYPIGHCRNNPPKETQAISMTMCRWSRPMRSPKSGPTVVNAVRIKPFNRHASTLTGEVRSAFKISSLTPCGRTGARTSMATIGTSARVVAMPAMNSSSGPRTLRFWPNSWPAPKNKPYTST